MSRTYQVLRNKKDFSCAKKVWVFVGKRGAKKFKIMVNKRCRRLDKIAIADGINDMIDNAEEVKTLIEVLFDEQYEMDYYNNFYDQLEDLADWYEEDLFEDDPGEIIEEDHWGWRDPWL